jgi:hypothetical protein
MNNWNLAMLLERDAGRIAVLAGQLPQWILMVGIAGRERLPEERLAYQEKDISEMAQKCGLQLLPAVPGAGGEETLKAILDPCGEPYWKLAYKGGCQELFFLSTLDRSPEYLRAMHGVAEAQACLGIGVYIQPVQQGASCHIEFNAPFDPADFVETGRMKQIYRQGSEEMLKHGAYYSRPYGIWSSLAFGRDAQTTIALRRIKGIFDPNNILNPGKLCF